MNLTQERLKEVMHYDPLTGQFTWIKTLSRRAVAGTKSGNPYSNGYLRSCIDGEEILCHRLAWFYMTGIWPDHEVDHKNRVRSDNSWNNLRPSTNSQNKMNRLAHKGSKSGIKGVSWSERRQLWQVSICTKGIRTYLGEFKDIELAKKAIEDARPVYHGEFATQ